MEVAGTMTCIDPGRNTILCGVSFESAVSRVTAIGQPSEIKPYVASPGSDSWRRISCDWLVRTNLRATTRVLAGCRAVGRMREGSLGIRGARERGLIEVGGSGKQVTGHAQEQRVAASMAGMLAVI